MLKKITLSVFLLTCALFASVSAQTVADTEKQASIKELVALMNPGMKMSDIMNMIDAQANQIAREVLEQTLAENKDFTEEDKKLFRDSFNKDQINLQKRWQDKFLSKIDFDALIYEIAGSFYDKNFTLADIKELIVFYKSPTGQKLVKATPLMLEESMRVMSEKLIPKMTEVSKEIEAEMKREVEQKLSERKTKKKTL